MSDLTIPINPDLTVDSRVIAQHCDVDHRSAYRLLTEHKALIESQLGLVRFEIASVRREGERGEKHAKFALLTEPQATALITLFRNSEPVLRFKVALSRAFHQMRTRLHAMQLTRTDFAHMVLELDRELKQAQSVLDQILPQHAYGSLTKSGTPRTGIRRASFVAAPHRRANAAQTHATQLSMQLEASTQKENAEWIR
ncbi:hypothetical protein DB346_05580 [Verrucomicrobia bacterium LW23]|nr:hypothetical protein DB346_05580 [Verrucomicrobia bacterium LW23]